MVYRIACAAAAGLLTLVAATGPSTKAVPNALEIARIIKNKVPEGVPADFECGWRKLAYQYAQQLQPFRTASEFQEIFDDLLGNCPQAEFSMPEHQVDIAKSTVSATGSSYYVDPVNGKDSNPGTLQQPFQTLPYAVSETRQQPSGSTIFLRAGVYRLAETLQLGPQDNSLTISAYGSEIPVISSGVVLPSLQWTAYNVSGNRTMQVFNNSNNVYGEAGSDPAIVLMGVFSNPADCQAACLARPNCTAFTWHGPIYGQPWNQTCWERSDNVWNPTAEADIVSGYFTQPMNVWVADVGTPGTAANPLPTWLNTPSRPDFVMSMLYSPDGGVSTQRATRARYPNANPETDRYPIGWTGAGSYVRTPVNQATEVVHVPNPNPGDPAGMFASDYYWGFGGPCERFTDAAHANQSYWCQPNGRVAGDTYFVNTPSALTVSAPGLPNAAQYAADPSAAINGGAIVNYWRHGHWFTLMSRLASIVPNGTAGDSITMNFGLGQFQGCEGDATGENWYIENSPFELDFSNEFWYDASTGKLYFFYNGTQGAPPPASWTFEVPILQTLINISGTSDAPATGITLSGLTFTSAAPSFLAPHGLPSGGDWGLSRVAAVQLEGTQGVTVESSTFSRVDGNGVSITGWNRNATVDKCSFKWMGESAVITWGNDHGVDATALDIPLGTVVSNNLCRLIGSTEKQVSCFGQFVSARSVVKNNVFFNMPRAAINFNDYVGGGSEIAYNLVWDTCMESQDHGPFNSWDRVPYHAPDGFREPYELHHNFMVAGGGANGGAWDNDDGSSFYEIHDNVEIYGGHKSDFDGHSKRHYNSLNLFSNVYGAKCVGIMNLPNIPGFAEGYYNSTCVLTAGADYMDVGSPCNAKNATAFAEIMMVGGNTVYVDGNGGGVSCGGSYTFQEWAATGVDPGTTISTTLPTTAQMMQWAAALLDIQQ